MTTPYPAYPAAYVPRPAQPPAHPRATAAMVLGIISVAGFFVLLVPVLIAPLAWYFGAVAVRDAEREPMRYRPVGQARAGMVLGIIGTALLAFVLLMLFVVGALIVIGARYDAGYGT
jgi:hypothetical protein